jgi:hypothetical protein
MYFAKIFQFLAIVITFTIASYAYAELGCFVVESGQPTIHNDYKTRGNTEVIDAVSPSGLFSVSVSKNIGEGLAKAEIRNVKANAVVAYGYIYLGDKASGVLGFIQDGTDIHLACGPSLIKTYQ